MSTLTASLPDAGSPRTIRVAIQAGLPWIILAVIAVLCVAVNPAFLTWSTIRLQLIQGALIGLVAIGETLAILIGHIDLSIPWTITLSGILATNAYAAYPAEWVPFAVVILVGAGVGLVNFLGIYGLRVHSLIWTLSVNLALQGITLVYTNATASAPVVPPAARTLALGVFGGVPVAAIVWTVCGAAAILALRRLPFGRAVYAIGNNELVALASGVRLGATYVAVFVVSGLGAALVGLMLAGYSSQAYLGMGNDYLLPPVASVVIGGTRLSGGRGGYGGTIAGALSVVLLQAMLVSLDVSQGLREIIFGAILLTLVFLFIRRGDP